MLECPFNLFEVSAEHGKDSLEGFRGCPAAEPTAINSLNCLSSVDCAALHMSLVKTNVMYADMST